MVERETTITKGAIVLITGLGKRTDLNGQEGEALVYFEAADRWGVRAGTETVRVRTTNLILVKAGPAAVEEEEANSDEDEENEGLIDIKMGDHIASVHPRKLKRRFDQVIRQYGLQYGDKSDKLADLLTREGVTPGTVAEEFDMTLTDAHDLMLWINVGIKFKEEAMKGAGADQLGQLLGG